MPRQPKPQSRVPLLPEQPNRVVSKALPMVMGAAASPVVQTVVLRVSIHCHGCKKKVRRVLKSVEGVQNVTVDAA
ncbi:hypothetical protein PVAP13_2NG336066 [Panicum virgatum]|uniref:HMA domain-containing protein n=1 Tax=Panicum virgatum TaxID=38727 RepID=A0A8T0VPE0_PANVG|nr:hypothetical protein PVAP13_2NG336066 [Panicum virgatum]